jgi:hypothetical protein
LQLRISLADDPAACAPGAHAAATASGSAKDRKCRNDVLIWSSSSF